MSTLRFQMGGTLDPRSSVYVTRPEDSEFLDTALETNAWINVYGCRTMGKSSLYAQHLNTLRERGVRPIVVDVGAQVGSRAGTGRDWVQALAENVAFESEIDMDCLTKPILELPEDVAPGSALECLAEALVHKCRD